MSIVKSISDVDNILSEYGFVTSLDDSEYGVSISVRIIINGTASFVKVIDDADLPLSDEKIITSAIILVDDFIVYNENVARRLNGRTEISMDEALNIF